MLNVVVKGSTLVASSVEEQTEGVLKEVLK